MARSASLCHAMGSPENCFLEPINSRNASVILAELWSIGPSSSLSLYCNQKLIMATHDDQRHRMIKRAVMQRPEAIVDVTIHLWQRLASELISIIGEGGFQSLYSRGVHLTRVTFPWIVPSHSSQPTDSAFAGLKICLAGRDFKEASEASAALLNTFIDILIALIGELLTTSILRSAWGDDAVDIVGKELL